LCLIFPTPEFIFAAGKAGLSEDAFLMALAATDTNMPNGAPWYPVDRDTLPETRDYRAAWKVNIAAKSIELDQVKVAAVDAARAAKSQSTPQLPAP